MPESMERVSDATANSHPCSTSPPASRCQGNVLCSDFVRSGVASLSFRIFLSAAHLTSRGGKGRNAHIQVLAAAGLCHEHLGAVKRMPRPQILPLIQTLISRDGARAGPARKNAAPSTPSKQTNPLQTFNDEGRGEGLFVKLQSKF